MNKVLVLAGRTTKEILRDSLTTIFGVGLPVLLIIFMSILNKNMPVDVFNIESLAPGMAVFSQSFLTLFSAMLIARDRETALLERLYTTPLKSIHFMLGYSLPMIPLAICQGVICYVVALMFGLTPSVNILTALVTLVFTSIFFISLGLLFGSILNTKQVGGICGAMVTTLTSLLGGVFADFSMADAGFKIFLQCFPFIHLVSLEKCVLNGVYNGALVNFIAVLVYTIATFSGAIALFYRQMRKH